MGNISRMSGTSWHVTQIKTEEERQMRRGKCKFFDRKKTICRCKISPKYLLTCLTSARCDYYEEGKFVKEPNHNPFKEDLNSKKVDNKESKQLAKSNKKELNTEANKVKDKKESKPIIPKRISVEGKVRIGDIVDIVSIDESRTNKTFKMLPPKKNGKCNEITSECKGKHVNDIIKYKNKEYRIIKIERIKK